MIIQFAVKETVRRTSKKTETTKFKWGIFILKLLNVALCFHGFVIMKSARMISNSTELNNILERRTRKNTPNVVAGRKRKNTLRHLKTLTRL